jgi:GTP-binding protein
MSLPTVAVIGRPNVGKSSLFNRFLQKKIAVVDEVAGVTRDRNYSICDWAGRSFYLIDTGGIVPDSSDLMEKLITDQTDFAIFEADLILFLVDSHTGVDSVDLKIARSLKKAGRNCLLIANKADNEVIDLQAYEFMKLGLGEPVLASATGGRGIGELLDKVVENLPEDEKENESDDKPIRIAVVGRPNVGKSSFINKLIGQDRLIVTPIAGTTRDAVDTPFEYDDQKYTLIDTAGLRRKYKVTENIEFYTNLRTDRALESCDVAVVIVDATEKVSSQDQKVLDKVLSTRRPAVLVVNKWDLIEKDSYTADQFTKDINDILSKYSYLPIIYISALSGQRVSKVIDFVNKVHQENHKRLSTSELNDFLQRAVAKTHPPARKAKHIKLNYITQSEVAPPTFIIFSNYPELIDKAYIMYLNNQLRNSFGFEGIPIRLKFKNK